MDKKKEKRELDSFQETHRKKEYENLSFTVVLVKPEHSGNIGSIARVMENFDFKNLVIFNPFESIDKILSYETQGFAMHGKDILFDAKIIEVTNQENHMSEFKQFMKKFDYIIATTAQGRKYSNIRRLAIFPEDLNLPVSVKPLKIAILFGKESRGLTNEKISLADILLRIPTSNNYSALNLSHACGITLYEIFKKINKINVGRGKNPVILADRQDRQILYKMIQIIIDKLKIRTYKKDMVYFSFRNIFERTFMSKKELSLITGVFSKVSNILKEMKLYDN